MNKRSFDDWLDFYSYMQYEDYLELTELPPLE
jgi:hypothetical protein